MQRGFYDAARRGHLQVVKVLLQAGTPVDGGPGDGITPLHEAVENGHLEVARLLKSGADVNRRDSEGRTPLEIARKRRDRKMLRLLQQMGTADRDRKAERSTDSSMSAEPLRLTRAA